MSRFIFSLPDDELNALRQLSQDTQIPVASLLRTAVKTLLSQNSVCNVVMSGTIISGAILIIRG